MKYLGLGALSFGALLSVSAYGFECKPIEFSEDNANVRTYWEALLQLDDDYLVAYNIKEACVTSSQEVKVSKKGDGFTFSFADLEASYFFKESDEEKDNPLFSFKIADPTTIDIMMKDDNLRLISDMDTSRFEVIFYEEDEQFTIPFEMDMTYDLTYNIPLKAYVSGDYSIDKFYFDLSTIDENVDAKGDITITGIEGKRTSAIDDFVDYKDFISMDSIHYLINATDFNMLLTAGKTIAETDQKGLDKRFFTEKDTMSQCWSTEALLDNTFKSETQMVIDMYDCMFQAFKGKTIGDFSTAMIMNDFNLEVNDSYSAPFKFASKKIGYNADIEEADGNINAGYSIILNENSYDIDPAILEAENIPADILPKDIVYGLKLSNIKREMVDNAETIMDLAINNIDVDMNLAIILQDDIALKSDTHTKLNSDEAVTFMNAQQTLPWMVMMDPTSYELESDVIVKNQAKLVKLIAEISGQPEGVMGVTLAFFGEKISATPPIYKYNIKMENGEPIINGKKIPAFGK
ncbi:MAG: hypothetical protein ACK5LE_00975 [Alphaproteobacteria bacterium]